MNVPKVTIVDYGIGNLLSVRRGLEHCGAKVNVTGVPAQIKTAPKLVLPGVGAFGKAMLELERLSLTDAIREVVRRQTPLLGICLGMQLLLDESSEFGQTAGFGFIPGRVIPIPTRTPSGEPLKIPHIGWSELRLPNGARTWHGTVLEDNQEGEAVYFVHSFMAEPLDPTHRIANYAYGGHLVAAVIGRDNVTGCQFHPEKSGEVGLKVLRKFVSK